MGEEEKKPAEEKKPEEANKAAAEGEEEEGQGWAEKPAEDGKKEEKKSEEPKGEQQESPPPPPPPQEIVLRVFMHCEGCARKVRRCLKGFPGVEDVITDCRASKVVVKGEKADPVKVYERVQRKSHRQVELISPIPKPPPEEKPEEKEEVKPEEKKEEPPVITVVLGVYMHCEACAQEIKRRIQRMKGVESAEPDLKSSQVNVKGVFEPEKLAEYVYKRTGKHAAIIKVEPESDKVAAKKGEEEPAKENKEAGGDAGGGSGGEPPAKAEAEAEDPKLEVRKNEFYYYYPQNYQLYPQRFIQEMNAYPPQIFSDENPNACSVM
ncbi:heavy metal-associated isoprenylated plant protein 7-like [Sesamum indicum]|uniref:Heavy metal-associated isoprenylated plant protein 7-like n=1 Tax=Sesamum indicum TaxID=4182 RepID=A0A6I9SST4_SESIN|nr:heavy metal-associated isoprenylated plant protein 7-like [Sesamum indicum]